MTDNNLYIRDITIEKFWGKYQVAWELDPKVNILVGGNGSGKSTILRLIEDAFALQNLSDLPKGKINKTKIYIYFSNYYLISNVELVHFTALNCVKISTFDESLRDKSKLRKNNSPLDLTLESLLYQRFPNIYSFSDYRLKATNPNSGVSAEIIQKRINLLFQIIDSFFAETHKHIFISDDNRVCFRKENQVFDHDDLSSGEKQLLIILFKVFLQEEKPFVLLMDEPEISLDTEWQAILIEKILALNPLAQLIIVTHSPSIFGDGWGDKLVWMEDIITQNTENHE